MRTGVETIRDYEKRVDEREARELLSPEQTRILSQGLN
jgi:hypothetical protein